MKKIITFALVLMCCVSISFDASGQEIKVGTLIALTGPVKAGGTHIQNATVLAAKQMTDAGFEIELVHEDSESSAGPAQSVARKLVKEDKVVAIVGAISSGVTKPVAEKIACPNNVLMISPASTSPVLTLLPRDKGKDILFRTCPSDTLQGVVLGKLAANRYKTAAVMYVDNPYGKGLAEQFKKSFEKRKGKVVKMVGHDEKEAESYVDHLKKALAKFMSAETSSRTAKNRSDSKSRPYFEKLLVRPDVLCVFSYSEHAKVYVKEAIDLFLYRNFLFCDGSKSEDVIKTVGAANLNGMMGTAPGAGGGDSYINFNIDFKTEFGELSSDPFITNAYDAMATIGLAAYAAKAKGLPLVSKNIRKFLRVVANPPGEVIKPGEFKKAFDLLNQGKEINYEGASGSVDFDENGDVLTPIEVWQYSMGKIVTSRMEYQIPEE